MEPKKAQAAWWDNLPEILIFVFVCAVTWIAVSASVQAHEENKSLDGAAATIASLPFGSNGVTAHIVVALEEGPLKSRTKEVLSLAAVKLELGDKVTLEWRERYPYAKPTELPTWEGDLWVKKIPTTSSR